MTTDRFEERERTFLALCLAMPDHGAAALAELDVERDLTTEVLRRAAEHLRGRLATPLEGLAEDDDELRAAITELAVRSAGLPASDRVVLEGQTLQLQLARLDRELSAAVAAADGNVADLQRARQAVQGRLDALAGPG